MFWNEIAYFVTDHFAWLALVSLAVVMLVAVQRRNQRHRAANKTLQEAHSKNLAEPFSLHPSIDAALCTGCGACVRACPEGEILQLLNHRAALVAPTKCVGHGECEAACPFSAITLVFGTKTRGKELPRISTDFETNIPGLYIAGELGGMGLIRNAVRQGRMAVEHAAKHLTAGKAGVDVDVLIVGSGPAGIAAALGAKVAGVRYLCLEQGQFGGTIANFPRQKLIMSQPAELPLVGVMKFPGHKVAKEQLMQRWQEIRQSAQLQVREQTKFQTLRQEGGIFHVETSTGAITAQKVILALGVRGTPRKLGLAGEALAKVTYNLLEPEQYQNQDIAVVGSGNAAAEAVQMLAAKELSNRVTMLVATADFDRCNDENMAKVRALVDAGRVRLLFSTAVTEINPDDVRITNAAGTETLKNDFLFIFIGAEMQSRFFTELGIQIERKFGEPRARGQAAP